MEPRDSLLSRRHAYRRGAWVERLGGRGGGVASTAVRIFITEGGVNDAPNGLCDAPRKELNYCNNNNKVQQPDE